MLSVDLGRLGREGSVLVDVRVPADDGLWHDSDLTWSGDIEIRLTATFAGTGEIVVRGRARGALARECRRCLEPVRTEVDEELTLVFAGGEEAAEGSDVYPLDPSVPELDLREAVREELILAINPYVLCDPECRGLCATCGANLNEGECGCTRDEIDPRWEALRGLASKDE